jgi:anti-sigma regulatory factor (Ser/Thr protein kinase)
VEDPRDRLLPLHGEQALARDAAAARAARRLVTTWMRDTPIPEGVKDDVALVTSELVTNAVLHAMGDDLHLRLRGAAPGGCLLEVEDHYEGWPSLRAPDSTRAGGHGLRLLEELTSAWGVTATAAGKIVWAAFGEAGEHGAPASPSGADAVQSPAAALRAETGRFRTLSGTAPAPQRLVQVRLLGLPLALFAAQLAGHRELLRELELVARAPGRSDSPALVRLAHDLASYKGMGESTEEERAAAAARGESTLDITYQLPVDAGPACERMMHLLHEADTFARERALLVLPAPAPEVAVREWFLCEITRQCAGAPPTPWDGPLHRFQPRHPR